MIRSKNSTKPWLEKCKHSCESCRWWFHCNQIIPNRTSWSYETQQLGATLTYLISNLDKTKLNFFGPVLNRKIPGSQIMLDKNVKVCTVLFLVPENPWWENLRKNPYHPFRKEHLCARSTEKIAQVFCFFNQNDDFLSNGFAFGNYVWYFNVIKKDGQWKWKVVRIRFKICSLSLSLGFLHWSTKSQQRVMWSRKLYSCFCSQNQQHWSRELVLFRQRQQSTLMKKIPEVELKICY